MTKLPHLSIVVPSFNERSNLERNVLETLPAYLSQQAYTWEVILSDDGSRDGTVELLEQFADRHENVRVLRNPHRGKAPTVKAGMLAARGSWRLFTDFDQSTPINEIEKLLPYTKNFEVIIGSREMIGAKRDKEPLHRHLMGRAFNLVVQALAVPGVLDTQCGFKLFSARATEHLFRNMVVCAPDTVRSDPFTGAFDVELLFLATKYGFQIREGPILWRHHLTDRVSPIKDSLRMLRDIFRIRIADLQRKYPPVLEQ